MASTGTNRGTFEPSLPLFNVKFAPVDVKLYALQRASMLWLSLLPLQRLQATELFAELTSGHGSME